MISASCAASLVGCWVMTAIGAPSDQAWRIAPHTHGVLPLTVSASSISRLLKSSDCSSKAPVVDNYSPQSPARPSPSSAHRQSAPTSACLPSGDRSLTRLNGRPAEAPAPIIRPGALPAYRRGGDINQPGDIRQTGADRLRYLLIILMQHRQHIGGGEAIDVGGLRVTTSLALTRLTNCS